MLTEGLLARNGMFKNKIHQLPVSAEAENQVFINMEKPGGMVIAFTLYVSTPKIKMSVDNFSNCA